MNIEELKRIVLDCEWMQIHGKSGYEKEQAKISAYNNILDLMMGDVIKESEIKELEEMEE